MVNTIGWTPKAGCSLSRISAKLAIIIARCTISPTLVTMVRFPSHVYVSFQPSNLVSLVYLDNPTAVNELLIAELDEAEKQQHPFASSRS
jgi:hypothetical protein